MPPQKQSPQNLDSDPADPHLDYRNNKKFRAVTSSGRETTAMYIARVISREIFARLKAEQPRGQL